jgi:tripartite-type tricarboxylate transporter receptor subunit TctC
MVPKRVTTRQSVFVTSRARTVPAFGARRGLLVATLALGLLASASGDAAESTFGSGTLRIIVPANPGSGMDTAARTFRGAFSKALGDQPVIIENRPGAGGIVGTRSLMAAQPDGTTIGLVSNSYVLNPSVGETAADDQKADAVTAISFVARSPFVFVVNPSNVPAGNARELRDLLRAAPDSYTYGSSGSGSITELAAGLYFASAAVKARHIPYNATSTMLVDLRGGRIDMGVFALSLVRQQIESGALRAIGVMSRSRIPALASVPTFVEQGYPEVELSGWIVAAGPPGLAKQHVARVYDALVAALNDRAVAASMAQLDVEVVLMPPEATTRFLQEERARYARLGRKLKPE